MSGSNDVRGRFVWYELMTTDMAAAEAFYREVVGWSAQDSGMAEPRYTMLLAGSRRVAGLMAIPEHATGMHPHWTGYIGVDDVDAYTEKVRAAGGVVHRAPQDIPGVGRFSVVGDPQGAGILLFTPAPGSQPPAQVGPEALGHIGWRELHAADGDQALKFYSEMFGWSEDDSVDMGSMGTYHIFTTGGPQVGGIMTKMPGTPFPPMWLYYFNVEAIEAAVERVKGAGGQVVQGPHQVPGETWIVQCLDPQGAMFALTSRTR